MTSYLTSKWKEKTPPAWLCIFLASSLVHCFVWIWVVARGTNTGRGWLDSQVFLDSQWYVHLASAGYKPSHWSPPGSEFAFLPLWPWLLSGTSKLMPGVPVVGIGLGLSAVFFACALRQCAHLLDEVLPDWKQISSVQKFVILAPLAFSPGGWIFLTNHTESLFLFLSVAALRISRHSGTRAFLLSAGLAGLSSLCRNQGVLVAVCVGITYLMKSLQGQSLSRGLRLFLGSGLISGSIYAVWPLFLWMKTGSPMASVQAQSHWRIVSSFSDYLSNLFWLSRSNGIRATILWSIVVVAIMMALKCRARLETLALSAYLILSVLLWPMQGSSFANAWRYSSVIFPFWLFLGLQGHRLMANPLVRKSRYVAMSVLTLLFVSQLNLLTRYLTNSAWPY